jgi:transcriptional regulator of acetoin/glycerol metabolism
MMEEVEMYFPTLDTVIAEHLMKALREMKSNQRRAANILGISRWSLSRAMKRYGIGKDGYPVVTQAKAV